MVDEPLAEKLAYWRQHGAPGVVRANPQPKVVVDERTGEKTKHTAVVHEHTGERVGRHINHSDGRVDAVAEKVDVHANPHAAAFRVNPPKET